MYYIYIYIYCSRPQVCVPALALLRPVALVRGAPAAGARSPKSFE